MAQLRKPKISSGPLESSKKNELLRQSNLPGWAKIVLTQSVKGRRDTDEVFAFYMQGLRRYLLLDMANLRGQDAVSWFWKKWLGLWPETPQDLIELRNELRRVWVIDSAQRLASRIGAFVSELPAEYLLNKWLEWRATAEQNETRRPFDGNMTLWLNDIPPGKLRFLGEMTAKRGMTKDRNEYLLMRPLANAVPTAAVPFQCSLWRRRLVPQPQNLRGMPCREFLRTGAT